MKLRRGVWHFLAVALAGAIAALMIVGMSGQAQARNAAQTAPTATPVATTAVTTGITGTKSTCTSGIGMGETVCPTTRASMGGFPSTGGGGTARIVVPARLPRTGGGSPGSSDDSVLLALAALVLAGGMALSGWARRSALRG